MEAIYTIPMGEGQDQQETMARGQRMETARAAGTLSVQKTVPARPGFVVVSDPEGVLFEINRRSFCPDWLLALCKQQIGG